MEVEPLYLLQWPRFEYQLVTRYNIHSLLVVLILLIQVRSLNFLKFVFVLCL